MTLDRRISIVCLGVEDVARATEFYARLGWSKAASASAPGISFIGLKGTVLSLYGRAALAEEVGVAEAPKGFSGVTLAQNVASEAEVDAAFAFALAAGATPVTRPKKMFWGGYSGYFADPDGHVWEIAHNPFFRLDETGHVVLPD